MEKEEYTPEWIKILKEALLGEQPDKGKFNS